MQITKRKLRQIIQEEVNKISEAVSSSDEEKAMDDLATFKGEEHRTWVESSPERKSIYMLELDNALYGGSRNPQNDAYTATVFRVSGAPR